MPAAYCEEHKKMDFCQEQELTAAQDRIDALLQQIGNQERVIAEVTNERGQAQVRLAELEKLETQYRDTLLQMQNHLKMIQHRAFYNTSLKGLENTELLGKITKLITAFLDHAPSNLMIMNQVTRLRFEWGDKGRGIAIRYRPGEDPDEWVIDKIFPHPHGGTVIHAVSNGVVGVYGDVEAIEVTIIEAACKEVGND
jgi:hypothetical protein